MSNPSKSNAAEVLSALSRQGPISVRTFAFALGLVGGSGPAPRNECDRMTVIVLLMHYLRTASRPKQEKELVWTQFCADYLPAVVDKFIGPMDTSNDLPQYRQELLINNAYFEVLSFCPAPYVHKYLLSQKSVAANNRNLPRIFGQRLSYIWETRWKHRLPRNPANESIAEGPSYDDRKPEYFSDKLGRMLKFYGSLLAVFIEEVEHEQIVPNAVRFRLKFQFRSMSTYQSCQTEHLWYLGHMAQTGLALLNRDLDVLELASEVKKCIGVSNQCTFPGCEVTHGLRACGKCQTVQYCSAAHQKQHWKHIEHRHKFRCVQTEY